jgi:CPA2 family monovalent cation:H+ antiporter-2
MFFFFFGLQIDPATLPPAMGIAVALGIMTTLTKALTGYWAARKVADARGRWRAGAALVARGEFSIVIAGLGAGLEPQLGPLAAAYVLFLAVLGPVLARMVK